MRKYTFKIKNGEKVCFMNKNKESTYFLKK